VLLDGSSGSRLYASTKEEVFPTNTAIAACEIESGESKGSVAIRLTHGYLFGMVGGYVTSTLDNDAEMTAPTALYVKSTNEDGTEFTLYCESASAPSNGNRLTYTANLVFLHQILADSSAF
jgi:hypothetical protein